MSSIESTSTGLQSALLLLTLFFTLQALPGSLSAQEPIRASEPEVWLLTYGPGDIYWQRFGHNAIWIRDEQLGLDHAFNFGFFDFEQEDFFWRFLQGRMLYFSAARPAQREFAAYISENRSIRAQRLNLSLDQKFFLIDFLVEEVEPENREYLYDYYLNNCSTRVRDALDLALQGALSRRFQSLPATQNFRDHTRRLVHADFWLYLGLEIVLGAPVDRDISRWDEMFIPSELAEAVEFMRLGPDDDQPLVLEEAVLFESSLPPPPGRPGTWWPAYLLLSAALLAAAWVTARLAPAGARRTMVRAWLLLSGLAGVALTFFWLGTDHAVAADNLNLLVLNPLWVVLAFWQGSRRVAGGVLLGFCAAALLMPFLPPHQYTLDVLAAVLPLNLACAFYLLRRSPPAT